MKVLGAMEPPAHDKFEAALIINKTFSNGNKLSVADGEKILKEIDQFKREQLLAIREKYNESVTTLDFIDDIFNSLDNGIALALSLSQSRNDSISCLIAAIVRS